MFSLSVINELLVLDSPSAAAAIGRQIRRLTRPLADQTIVPRLPGSILEGPDSTKLKPLVEQVLPILLQLMKDPVVAVKACLGISTEGR